MSLLYTSAIKGINFHFGFIIQHTSDSKLPAFINITFFVIFVTQNNIQFLKEQEKSLA